MTNGRPGALDRLLDRVRDCRVCAAHLPHPPRPVLRASVTAKLMIVGQAPGTRVHETGIPFNDPSGDAPPRPECAPLWHADLRALMPGIALTLLVGAYAQAYYLGDRREKTLAATVRNWRAYGPEFLPTPHPSPRNKLWLKRNPWFEADVVPELRARVHRLIGMG
jgi:uracil-DNA glycosylase